MSNTLTVPIFKREDWDRIKATSMDDVQGSYDDYIRELRKRLAAHKKRHLVAHKKRYEVVREVEIDYDELLAFLREKGLANVADNRYHYIITHV